MSAVCPFPAAFTVFAGDGSRESLLIVSLDDSCALTCPDPLVRPRFTLNDWTQHHLPIRAICDAIALLFGCLDLSTASEYAIATDCLRYKIFDIQSDGYIGSAMDDEALQKHVTPGSGVFFQLSTYDGRIVPFADAARGEELKRCMAEFVDAALRQGVAQASSAPRFALTEDCTNFPDAACLVFGQEPVLCAMHVYERRWGDETYKRLIGSLGRLVDAFARDLARFGEEGGSPSFKFDWHDSQRVFAPAYKPIFLTAENDDNPGDAMNWNFVSGNIMALFSSRNAAIHRHTFYYLNKVIGSSVPLYAKAVAKLSHTAPLDESVPALNVQYPPCQDILWDIRWTVTLIMTYQSSFLKTLINGFADHAFPRETEKSSGAEDASKNKGDSEVGYYEPDWETLDIDTVRVLAFICARIEDQFPDAL